MELERLNVQTSGHQEFHEITDLVAEHVATSGARDGLCYVFSPHTTAGLTINENADPDVRRDMLGALDRVVPLRHPDYRHAEGNSAAHVKASMMGFSVVVPIAEGRLVFGAWQGIYLCEFDGPRRRNVLVKIVET